MEPGAAQDFAAKDRRKPAPTRDAEFHKREREEELRAIGTAAMDAILMLDDDGSIIFWNDAASRIFGYPADEVLGRNAHYLLAPSRYHDAHAAAWPEFARNGRGAAVGKVLELEARRKDGSEFPIELSVSSVYLKKHWHAVGVVRDITERKRAEETLQRANRALRTVSACNMILVHASDERQLLAEMCKTIVEQGGYHLAWVGLAEDGGKNMRQVASAWSPDRTDATSPEWTAITSGDSPATLAMRHGTPQMARSITTDVRHGSWSQHAVASGYGSCLSLPLKDDSGSTFGVLNICATDPGGFTDDEDAILRELAADLAFGVDSLRTRQQRDHLQEENLDNLAQIKEALLGTIRAVAQMAEQRDPYTAGHQNRVADLSCAIAAQLGLDDDRIEGLRLAAMIHDIGKISIPAEILNRPGKLSTPEFEIIKSHAQAGYDIIKDIRFPWPIARMVLQHHERLDGSGYPQGLSGNEICLEARILAVADVVDAICAHRPYRPALGAESALTEIEAKRGMQFDAEVVDACLRLFREKGYSLDAGPMGACAV